MARAVILVIGMHRSGTSLTMQALDRSGAETGGDLVQSDEFNARGYWEPTEIVTIHDDIFASLEREWGRPEHLLPVDESWWTSADGIAAGAKIEAALCGRLARVGDDAVLALKDPRMSLLLPLWQRAAERLNTPLQLILCLRHPVAVARSLAKRDKMGQDMAEALWISYNTASMAYAGKTPLLPIRHEDWLTDSDACQNAIARFIGSSVSDAGTTPYESDLNHHVTKAAPIDPLVTIRWNEVSRIPIEGAIPKKLTARATEDLRVMRHMSILITTIRAEVGATPSYLLSRDIASYRKGFHDTLAAYQTESQTSAEIRKTVVDLGGELKAVAGRANEFLVAYQTEARTSADLRAALKALEEEFKALKIRALELHDAYQTQAKRTAYMRAQVNKLRSAVERLNRLNPLYWLSKLRRGGRK